MPVKRKLRKLSAPTTTTAPQLQKLQGIQLVGSFTPQRLVTRLLSISSSESSGPAFDSGGDSEPACCCAGYTYTASSTLAGGNGYMLVDGIKCRFGVIGQGRSEFAQELSSYCHKVTNALVETLEAAIAVEDILACLLLKHESQSDEAGQHLEHKPKFVTGDVPGFATFATLTNAAGDETMLIYAAAPGSQCYRFDTKAHAWSAVTAPCTQMEYGAAPINPDDVIVWVNGRFACALNEFQQEETNSVNSSAFRTSQPNGVPVNGVGPADVPKAPMVNGDGTRGPSGDGDPRVDAMSSAPSSPSEIQIGSSNEEGLMEAKLHANGNGCAEGQLPRGAHLVRSASDASTLTSLSSGGVVFEPRAPPSSSRRGWLFRSSGAFSLERQVMQAASTNGRRQVNFTGPCPGAPGQGPGATGPWAANPFSQVAAGVGQPTLPGLNRRRNLSLNSSTGLTSHAATSNASRVAAMEEAMMGPLRYLLPTLTRLDAIVMRLLEFVNASPAAEVPECIHKTVRVIRDLPPAQGSILVVMGQALSHHSHVQGRLSLASHPCRLAWLRSTAQGGGGGPSLVLRNPLTQEMVTCTPAEDPPHPCPIRQLLQHKVQPCPYVAGRAYSTLPSSVVWNRTLRQYQFKPNSDAYSLHVCPGKWLLGAHFDGQGDSHAACLPSQLALLEVQKAVESLSFQAASSHDIALLLLRFLFRIHNAILEVPEAYSTAAALYAMVPSTAGEYLLVYVIVGNINAYWLSSTLQEWQCLNMAPTSLAADSNQPSALGKAAGGRGWLPYNMALQYGMTTCQEDDVLLFCSDGLAACLDPLQMGRPPDHYYPGRFKDWAKYRAYFADAPEAAREEAAALLRAKAFHLGEAGGTAIGASEAPASLQALLDRLLEHCRSCTFGTRELHEQPAFQEADTDKQKALHTEAMRKGWKEGQYAWAPLGHVSIAAFMPRCIHAATRGEAGGAAGV